MGAEKSLISKRRIPRMDIVAIWLLYLVVVIVLWALFWYPSDSNGDQVSGLTSLFYSLLVGFLLIYLVAPSVNTEMLSDEERAWFNALLALSILLPVIVIGLMITYVYQKVYNHYECHSGESVRYW